MHDPDTFEMRLANALHRYTEGDPRQVDAVAQARAIAAARAAGRWRWTRPWARPGVIFAMVLVALLLAGAVMIVGSRPRESDPRPVPTSGAAGFFAPTGSMGTMRSLHTATLLEDGRVLVIGGILNRGLSASIALGSAELWDPATGTFSPAGSLAVARGMHTATLLQDGRVLVAGG